MRKIIERLLPIAVLCILLAGPGRAVFFPKKINTYENRYANRLALPAVQTWLDFSFQNQTENALNDQVLFTQTLKKNYNTLSSRLLINMLRPFLEPDGNHYVRFRNV